MDFGEERRTVKLCNAVKNGFVAYPLNMVFPVTTIFRAPVSEDSKEGNFILFKKGNYPVIEDVRDGKCPGTVIPQLWLVIF